MSTGGFQVDPGGDNVSDDHGGGKGTAGMVVVCVGGEGGGEVRGAGRAG